MMDNNREAFESWYLKDPENSPAYLASNDSGYCDDTVQMDWSIWSDAWQASRQAIEVEINVSGERYAWSDGVFNLKEDLTKQFSSLGIRVKGNEE